MITQSQPEQIRLAENGDISWQKDPTNPLPGEKIGVLSKGKTVTEPEFVMDAGYSPEGEDKQAVQDFVQNWLNQHVKEGLAPMFRLLEDDIKAEPARQIGQKIFDWLGILPRTEVQEFIDQMDDEARQCLRDRKVRFGPLLVYLPELKKPAAVRLQAMLLSLWNDKPLPAEVPADGIVSFSIEDKDIDKAYLLAIGYPVYGPRAMRVDMLDRVVCAVYDSAQEGKFQAQHQMAEWLGSNIADLYAVLEAMGHKKVSDPADRAEEKTAETSEENTEASAEPTEEKKEEVPQEKPELATFALKRGKASEGRQSGKKKSQGKKPSKKAKSFKKNKKSEPRERVYKAEVESKPEDSPFAILEQLKVGNKKD